MITRASENGQSIQALYGLGEIIFMMLCYRLNMTVDETTMERLAFIKHLHRKAEGDSKKPQPHAYTSILAFHDAVEMFLQLASEEVNATGDVGFLEYWNDIKQKSGVELTRKASMKRMNKARVNLKHHGNRPHKNDLESYRTEVRSFFEENTAKIFSIDYSQVSLVQLIKFEEARNKAQKAEEYLGNGDRDEALCQISASYDSMFDEFENRIRSQLGYTPYPTAQNNLSAPQVGPSYGVDSELFDEDVDPHENFRNAESESEEIAISIANTEEIFEDIFEELNYIYDSMKVMGLGIDHWRFQRFESLTPRVSSEGEPMHPYWDASGISKNEVGFCIGFLVEVAIELQNSPLDFDSEPNTLGGFDEWL